MVRSQDWENLAATLQAFLALASIQIAIPLMRLGTCSARRTRDLCSGAGSARDLRIEVTALHNQLLRPAPATSRRRFTRRLGVEQDAAAPSGAAPPLLELN
jgi:hypothetical protein